MVKFGYVSNFTRHVCILLLIQVFTLLFDINCTEIDQSQLSYLSLYIIITVMKDNVFFSTLPVGTLEIFVIFVCVNCGKFTKQIARINNYINFIISVHLNPGRIRNLMKRKLLRKFMRDCIFSFYVFAREREGRDREGRGKTYKINI